MRAANIIFLESQGAVHKINGWFNLMILWLADLKEVFLETKSGWGSPQSSKSDWILLG